MRTRVRSNSLWSSTSHTSFPLKRTIRSRKLEDPANLADPTNPANPANWRILQFLHILRILQIPQTGRSCQSRISSTQVAVKCSSSNLPGRVLAKHQFGIPSFLIASILIVKDNIILSHSSYPCCRFAFTQRE